MCLRSKHLSKYCHYDRYYFGASFELVVGLAGVPAVPAEPGTVAAPGVLKVPDVVGDPGELEAPDDELPDELDGLGMELEDEPDDDPAPGASCELVVGLAGVPAVPAEPGRVAAPGVL